MKVTLKKEESTCRVPFVETDEKVNSKETRQSHFGHPNIGYIIPNFSKWNIKYIWVFSPIHNLREKTRSFHPIPKRIYIFIYYNYINRKKIPIKEAWKVSRVKFHKYYIERIVVENQVTNVTNFLKRPSHPRSLESSKTLSSLELIFFLLSAGEHTFSSFSLSLFKSVLFYPAYTIVKVRFV